MSFLTRVGKSFRNRFIKWLDPDTWLWRGGNYFPTESGVSVSAESAMRVTAVYACVRILSWTMASLPLPIYRRLIPRGKERAPDHPLYRILHDTPNSEQTSFQFRALLMAHVCLWGNGYAEIEADAGGAIVALWPIPPWLTEPMRTKEGALYYEVTMYDGSKKVIPAYRMIHIMGVCTDGLKGLSPVEQARQSIGLSLATEEFGARFFGQGANVGGVASTSGKLSDEGYKRLQDSLEEKYAGLGKAHRIILLEEGLKYEKIGIPPNDAQFLETRRFQISDITRIYGVPSYMVNDTERTTSWGTGIEQMGIGLVVYTLRPWCVNWEQEIQRKLLLGSPEFFSEFLVDGLLRGDIAARYTAYAIGRQWGWLSADDVCELENRNPLPDKQGQVYLNPLNMISAKNYLKPIDPKKPEAPQLADPDEDNSRMRIVGGFRLVLADAAQRILKREEADIMRQARKFSADPAGFDSWLDRFYSEHREYFERQISPVVQSMAEAADMPAVTNLRDLSKQHSERNLMELRQVVEQARTSGADPAEALQKRFTEWGTGRAGDLVAAVTQFSLEGRTT